MKTVKFYRLNNHKNELKIEKKLACKKETNHRKMVRQGKRACLDVTLTQQF